MDDLRGLQAVRQISLLRLDVLEVEDGVELEPGAHRAVQGGGPPMLVIASIRNNNEIQNCFNV